MHHPPDELLVDHASGASSPAEALLIALHLDMCPRCRGVAAELDMVGGALLEAIEPAPVDPSLLDRTLARIDGTVEPRHRTGDASVPPLAAAWPAPLRRLVAKRGLTRWRRMPAGFRALRLPFDDPSTRVWVMKAPAGRGPFHHGHTADEWTVVLEGGFSDETGTYDPGDFALARPGDTHRVIAKPDEGCVCVLLVRAAPRYTSWVGKLLAPFVRV